MEEGQSRGRKGRTRQRGKKGLVWSVEEVDTNHDSMNLIMSSLLLKFPGKKESEEARRERAEQEGLGSSTATLIPSRCAASVSIILNCPPPKIPTIGDSSFIKSEAMLGGLEGREQGYKFLHVSPHREKRGA